MKDIKERVLLLVDDEVNIATALKRLLRRDGYKILTADSGSAGLELLATHSVGVIISEQRMSEMTGVEFLRNVKKLYPETVRIVLSGYTDLSSVTAAINEGAIYKFLTKPWEDEQLLDNVREAFHHYELKQEVIRLGLALEKTNRELANINCNLEHRVEEKTLEMYLTFNALQVSQEVLQSLPAAVIGFDEDGIIVIANYQADALFASDGGGPLFGCEAAMRLPEVISECISVTVDANRTITLADGRHFRILCHRMVEASISRGTIVVILPVE
jgi:FixJ family two-component response regulator